MRQAEMLQAELREIGQFSALAGYWQFTGESGHHLAAFERNEIDNTGDRVRVFTLVGERWERAGQQLLAQPSAKAVDGYRVGTMVYLCIEVNRTAPLELWSVDYSALVGKRPESSPAFVGPLELSEEAVQKVQVPPARQWHAELEVAAWLFGPRFVRGDVKSPLVVAGTADGQVALLQPGEGGTPPGAPPVPNFAEPRARLTGVRDGLEPRALLSGEELTVAVLRPSQRPVSPFWVLPRYSKNPGATLAGELIVTQGAQPELNLSVVLGPVVQFALASAEGGRQWLFALIDAPVGTDVVALERKGGKWTVRGRHNLDPELRDVTAEWWKGEWRLVYAGGSPAATTLYYQHWRIDK